MIKIAYYTFSLILAGTVTMAAVQAPPKPASGHAGSIRPTGRNKSQEPKPIGPNPDSQYRIGPDSLPHDGVPKGEIRGPFTLGSKVYPGTQHTYWIYVPAQYNPALSAALMVFQDGQAFKDENGDMRAQNVMDNLIYRREIPVMIGVFHQSWTYARAARAFTKDWVGRRLHQPWH